MVKAFTIGVSVMTGILIGRVQIVEDHAANAAIRASERAAQRAATAEREAVRTRVLLDRTERQLVAMWRRLEPMLEDLTHAETLIERDAARRRIQSLQWEMSAVDATITAARETAGDDPRTAMRQAYVKQNFGQ